MAYILLNETDPVRHHWLQTRLEHSGHKVRSLSKLEEIRDILQETSIDIMVLDMDKQSLDDIVAHTPNLPRQVDDEAAISAERAL